MSGALLAVAVVAAGAAFMVWIALPLWRGSEPEEAPDQRAVALLAEREAILAALRDLDSDLARGRIDDQEHATLRTTTAARGAAVLAALDAVGAESAGSSRRIAAALEADVRTVASAVVAGKGDVGPG
ncbi:MAG: hypothetical protein ACE5EL_08870 [Anaerolineae bacterium]